jgi:acyl-CoA thioesterase YciA
MRNRPPQPRGELFLRTVAMQSDSNPVGDSFSGWLLHIMDLAVGIAARARAEGRIATASISNLNFLRTVQVGDVVCVYTNITKTGQTSITIDVEVYARRLNQGELIRVTAAEFVVVAVDDHRMPRTLPVAA